MEETSHNVGARQAETPDETSPRFVDDYFSYLLWQAAHGVAGQIRQEVRAAGIATPVWRALVALNDGVGQTVGDLAAAVSVLQPTMTKVIDRMERDGYVTRKTGHDDRRKTLIHITANGKKLIRDLLPVAKAHERALLSNYSDEEVARLKGILRDLIERSQRPWK
jgi:DNA-binding MarR family transcriptional regulator